MSRINPHKNSTVLPPILPKQPNLLLDTHLDQSDKHRFQHTNHLVQQSLHDLPALVNKLAQCEIDGCTFTKQHTLMEIARNAIKTINKHHAIRESQGNIIMAEEKLRSLNEDIGAHIATMVYQEIRTLRLHDVQERALILEDDLTIQRIKKQQQQLHNKLIKDLNEIEELTMENTASNTNINSNERMKVRSQYIVGLAPNQTSSIPPGSFLLDNPQLDMQLQSKYNTDTHLLIPFDHIGPLESQQDYTNRITSTLLATESTSPSVSSQTSYRVTPSYSKLDETVYGLNGTRYQYQHGIPSQLKEKNLFSSLLPSHHIDYSHVSSGPPPNAMSSTYSALESPPRSPQLQHLINAVPDNFPNYSNTYDDDHDDDDDDDDIWDSEQDGDDDDGIDQYTLNTMDDYYEQSSLGHSDLSRSFSDLSYSR